MATNTAEQWAALYPTRTAAATPRPAGNPQSAGNSELRQAQMQDLFSRRRIAANDAAEMQRQQSGSNFGWDQSKLQGHTPPNFQSPWRNATPENDPQWRGSTGTNQSGVASQSGRNQYTANPQITREMNFGPGESPSAFPQFGRNASAAGTPSVGNPYATGRPRPQTYTPSAPPTWGGMQVPQWNGGGGSGGDYDKGEKVAPYTVPQAPDWATAFPSTQFSVGNFNDKNSPTARYWENALPMAQFMQNANQWGQEFAQGNQRYWDESGWGKQRDTFNMGMANRQQQMAEWMANEQANQWGANFGQEQLRDEREWQMAGQQFGQQQLRDERDWQMAGQQFGLQQQRANTERELGLEANRIENMYKSGQLSNQQRELALAELKQKSEFGLAFRTQDELTAYRNAQMAQEAGLTRERIEADRQNAAMAAFGRSQAPTARWTRSW